MRSAKNLDRGDSHRGHGTPMNFPVRSFPGLSICVLVYSENPETEREQLGVAG